MNLNVDDWRDEYAEYCEENEIEPGDEYDIYNWMEDTNALYLDDERANLNKQLDGDILIIGDLGLWNGRKNGYKIARANLNAIFDISDDLTEFYGDGREIRATGCHHDGRNYYLFRAARPGRDLDKLLNALYCGEYISPQKLNYYTRSIYSDVARVYGWEV
jgi:hypothetical protein